MLELMAQLSAVGIIGKDAFKLAAYISKAYAAFLKTVAITSVDVGTVGVGSGIGLIVGPLPATYPTAILAQCAAVGLVGTFTPMMATAVGIALGTHTVTMGMVSSVHPTVGVGTGIGTIVGAVPPTFLGLLMAESSAAGLVGQGTLKFNQALANAIPPALTASVVSIVIAGPPSPSPSTGVGSGSIL
jgi:hypothetical protein